MNAFWIIGILANVLFLGVGICWAKDAMTFWAAVAAIGSMDAAIVAAVTTHRIRQSERTRLLSDWLIYYSSNEMGNALSILGAWHEEDPQTAVDRYVAAVSKKPRDPAGDAINNARRLAAHYFFRMAILWREELIDTKQLGESLQASAFEFFVNVIAPLDEAHARKIIKTGCYDTRARDLFRRVAKDLRRAEGLAAS